MSQRQYKQSTAAAFAAIALGFLAVSAALWIALREACNARQAATALQARMTPSLIASDDATLHAFAASIDFVGGSITLSAADANHPLHILTSAVSYAYMALVVPPASSMAAGDEFTFWFPVPLDNTRDIRWFPIEDAAGVIQEGPDVEAGTDGSAWITSDGGGSSTLGKLIVVANEDGTLRYAMLGGSLHNRYILT